MCKEGKLLLKFSIRFDNNLIISTYQDSWHYPKEYKRKYEEVTKSENHRENRGR